MASSWRKLTQLSQWKPKVRERALWVAIVSGPLAIVIALLGVILVANTVRALPKPVDTYQAITNAANVQDFARAKLVKWLAGGKDQEKSLLAGNTAEVAIDLSDAPFQVFQVEPAGISRREGTDATEWFVTFLTVMAPPGGSGAPQANYYQVTVIERTAGGGYQLLGWPRLVDSTVGTFTVASKYTVSVGKDTDLGRAMQNFATAYLTSQGAGSPLGQYVSSKFTGTSIPSSPYSTVELVSVNALSGGPALNSAKTGDTLSVMVRVKARASTDTWSVMDLPLKVSKVENSWVVDGFDDPVRWGRIDNPIGGGTSQANGGR